MTILEERAGPGRRGGSRPPTAETVLIGRTLLDGRLQPVEVGIDPDGVIVSVGRNVPGGHRHDVGDAVILPSATDLHVHFRDPGGPKDLESFESGTLQAAFGGVGLVGDMPNTDPPTTDAERLEAKASRARNRLAVGAFLYGAATAPVSVRRMAAHAAAFKLYLSPTPGIGTLPSPAALGPLFEAVASCGLALAVHAELPERFVADPNHPPGTPVEWDRARPGRSEQDAVERVLSAAPIRLRLHFAHLSLASTVDTVRAAGECAEATPQHLLLAARAEPNGWEKVNPPLREEGERAALWQRFSSGAVPILASDHAPHPLDQKARPFYPAPSGMPGVETMLPLMLEKVRAGELDLGVLARAACDRPARWIGVPHGRVAPGHLAHLIVVDFRKRSTVAARHLHAPCGWTAFEGWPAIFPLEHYRAGRPIVEGGEFVGDLRAPLVRPEYAPGGRVAGASP